MRLSIACFALALACVYLSAPAVAQGIRGSKHDLTGAQGWGEVRDEVCIFCHTPHAANKDPRVAAGPLWNRYATNATFTMYTSATLTSQCAGAPGSPSLLCLGCHDGAADFSPNWGGDGSGSKHDLINGYWNTPVNAIGNCASCHEDEYGTGPPKKWVSANGIGTNLSNDHPVSMVYPSVEQNPQVKEPPTPAGWPDVGGIDGSGFKLYAGRIECPTCHNVHSPRYAPFLRTPNDNSRMCLTCHLK